MADVYSPSLAFGMAMLAIAAAALAVRRLRPGRLPEWLSQLAASLALAAVALAIVSHVLLGHRPGTAGGLGLAQFVAVHPAPIVTGLAAALAIALTRRS